MTPQPYDGYSTWKGWKVDFSYTGGEADIYRGEVPLSSLANRLVVEIGYGNGGFLKWARDKGARVVGVEIQDNLLQAGRAAGFEVYGSLRPVLQIYEGACNLVVLFDVLEHLSLDEITATLRDCHRLLVNGGYLLAQFPNGQSPFGRVYQHGDATHNSTLSLGIIEQVTREIDFRCVRYGNSIRMYRRGSVIFRIIKRCQFLLRDALSRILCRLYDLGPIPLDPKVTIVLKARKADSGDSDPERAGTLLTQHGEF
jgi:SAM-dependent methyltransferase